MTRTILKLAEISERTGVPLATLRWLRHLNRGPKTWLLAGRVVAYADDVDQWVEEQQRTSEAS